VEVLGELTLWRVVLRSGSTLDVWAHGHREQAGMFVFEMLVRVDAEPGAGVIVAGRSRDDPSHIAIAVARIHTSEVDSIRSG